MDLEIDDLAYLRFISTDVDYSKKQVTANFFGLVKRIAVYNPELGSTLVYGYNANALDRPHPNPNTVELSTLTYQIVGRQPFAAETNRMPSRHRDADLHLNSTALPMREGILKLNASALDGGGGFGRGPMLLN